jgi:hypothetical protein
MRGAVAHALRLGHSDNHSKSATTAWPGGRDASSRAESGSPPASGLSRTYMKRHTARPADPLVKNADVKAQLPYRTNFD